MCPSVKIVSSVRLGISGNYISGFATCLELQNWGWGYLVPCRLSHGCWVAFIQGSHSSCASLFCCKNSDHRQFPGGGGIRLYEISVLVLARHLSSSLNLTETKVTFESLLIQILLMYAPGNKPHSLFHASVLALSFKMLAKQMRVLHLLWVLRC